MAGHYELKWALPWPFPTLVWVDDDQKVIYDGKVPPRTDVYYLYREEYTDEDGNKQTVESYIIYVSDGNAPTELSMLMNRDKSLREVVSKVVYEKVYPISFEDSINQSRGYMHRKWPDTTESEMKKIIAANRATHDKALVSTSPLPEADSKKIVGGVPAKEQVETQEKGDAFEQELAAQEEEQKGREVLIEERRLKDIEDAKVLAEERAAAERQKAEEKAAEELRLKQEEYYTYIEAANSSLQLAAERIRYMNDKIGDAQDAADTLAIYEQGAVLYNESVEHYESNEFESSKERAIKADSLGADAQSYATKIIVKRESVFDVAHKARLDKGFGYVGKLTIKLNGDIHNENAFQILANKNKVNLCSEINHWKTAHPRILGCNSAGNWKFGVVSNIDVPYSSESVRILSGYDASNIGNRLTPAFEFHHYHGHVGGSKADSSDWTLEYYVYFDPGRGLSSANKKAFWTLSPPLDYSKYSN